MLRLLSVWGHTPRPWGYEVRVDFTDDAGGIHNEVLTFAAEPSVSELDAAVAARLSQVEGRIAAEALAVPEPTREELVAKVADLEARVAVVVAERTVLVAEKEALTLERDSLLVAEPVLDVKVRL